MAEDETVNQCLYLFIKTTLRQQPFLNKWINNDLFLYFVSKYLIKITYTPLSVPRLNHSSDAPNVSGIQNQIILRQYSALTENIIQVDSKL